MDPQQGGSERLLDWISSAGDFLGTVPSYTFTRDPMLRLFYRLIACSIAGRSQAPENVTVTDLFYLRGMDVGSVNVSYLLARYLRLFALGRKQGAMISGGQSVLSSKTLRPGYPQDLLGRTRMHEELQRRLRWHQEVVMRMRRCLRVQREVLDSMASDFSRFTTWMVTSLARLMDRADVPYTRYSESPIEYQRRTRIKPGSKFTTIVREYDNGTKHAIQIKSRIEKRE
ncbi:hypothetical protein Tco_0740549 [Tanacetum coccineum]